MLQVDCLGDLPSGDAPQPVADRYPKLRSSAPAATSARADRHANPIAADLPIATAPSATLLEKQPQGEHGLRDWPMNVVHDGGADRCAAGAGAAAAHFSVHAERSVEEAAVERLRGAM
eukprot:CAMPEP_0182798194 /NCGR_PEP_ID=MMETSP0006_2-20121128/1219_1 /TAXON_ID=97485 /ORGANISM="Prymnesium parvum, Strain Texoma1" /LENGTH=117 /DNA_ID=CAMNT_0024923293 /DNA_START=411 /DNA_END=761 /DNA_ORIENTATION=-